MATTISDEAREKLAKAIHAPVAKKVEEAVRIGELLDRLRKADLESKLFKHKLEMADAKVQEFAEKLQEAGKIRLRDQQVQAIVREPWWKFGKVFRILALYEEDSRQ